MNRLLIILVSCSLSSSSVPCPHFLGFVTQNCLFFNLGSPCLTQASQVHSPPGTALLSLLYVSFVYLAPPPLLLLLPPLHLPPLPPLLPPSPSSFLSALVKISSAVIKHRDNKPAGGEEGLFYLPSTSQSVTEGNQELVGRN